MRRSLQIGFAALLSLGLLGPLTGCASWMAQEQAAVQNEPSAEAAVRGLLAVLLGRPGADISRVSSLPFWAGGWIEDPDTLQQSFAAEGDSGHDPARLELTLRLYPVGDLEAFDPALWRQLQAAGPELLGELRLGVVGLHLPTADEGDAATERLLLLMRRVDGQWRVAGLLEGGSDSEDVD